MQWNYVQTEAKKQRYLVFAMDQSQTPVMTQPGPWGKAHSGFCAGCAVYWIALRYIEADFAFDRTTLEVNMPDWWTTRDQNVFDDMYARDEFPLNLNYPFSLYSLTVNLGMVTCKSSALSGEMLTGAGQATGCYYIALRKPQGGHAIAMQNLGGGKWRLFDANYGEFFTECDQDFVDFVDWYAGNTGYRTEYAETTRIVGINPPPFVAGTFEAHAEDLIKKVGS